MSKNPYNLNQLQIILLGAGKSERFEAIKLLAQVKDKTNSKPLIQHVLQQISASLTKLNIDESNLHVATGGYHEQISGIIGQQFSVSYCSHAHLGLGHTIAQSVERVINSNDGANISHIMITLADQVALTSDDYVRLVEQSLLTPEQLVCATAGGEIMPPAIFPRCYFTQLMNLTGDKGAKALLHQNKENLQEVSLPNAVIDIDTRQDLIHWHKEVV